MKSSHQGDEGFTSLLGSQRVLKSDLRPEAYGTLDEASAALGLARAAAAKARTNEIIRGIQQDLVTASAEIATPADRYEGSIHKITAAHVRQVELLTERLEQEVEIGRQFVQPGATIAEAALHLARAIVRRAERRVVSLREDNLATNPELLRFLNRLSDLLFVLALFEATQVEEQR